MTTQRKALRTKQEIRSIKFWGVKTEKRYKRIFAVARAKQSRTFFVSPRSSASRQRSGFRPRSSRPRPCPDPDCPPEPAPPFPSTPPRAAPITSRPQLTPLRPSSSVRRWLRDENPTRYQGNGAVVKATVRCKRKRAHAALKARLQSRIVPEAGKHSSEGRHTASSHDQGVDRMDLPGASTDFSFSSTDFSAFFFFFFFFSEPVPVASSLNTETSLATTAANSQALRTSGWRMSNFHGVRTLARFTVCSNSSLDERLHVFFGHFSVTDWFFS